MRLLIALAVAPAMLCTTELRAGDLGGCYDGAIASCNLVYPESENWGTKRYRACIKALLDECDAKHAPPGLKFKALPGKKPLSLKQR